MHLQVRSCLRELLYRTLLCGGSGPCGHVCGLLAQKMGFHAPADVAFNVSGGFSRHSSYRRNRQK